MTDPAPVAPPSPAVSPRRHRPVSWRTWLPIVISLGAASFTGLQWWEAHTDARLAIKPSVDFFIGDDPDEPPVGIAITNAWPGPAVIKAIQFYVNRMPVRDADDAGRNYGKLSDAELDYYEFDPGDTLAVGEKEWLIAYKKPHRGKANQKTIDSFSDFVDDQLAIKITFCSISGDCWPKCSTKGRCD